MNHPMQGAMPCMGWQGPFKTDGSWWIVLTQCGSQENGKKSDTRSLFSPFGAPPAFLPGEDNGTPLQYSCLENPMDRGAWWAAVHGVAKSRT